MKKQYSVPKLTSHGSVEAITEFFGKKGRKDFLFFNGNSSPAPDGIEGSIDGIVVPKPNK